MATLTISLDEKSRNNFKEVSWLNWSEISREELIKKEMFERYIKSREITDEDWAFCESIDWHPVDELPLKESFVKKLKAARKEKPIKVKSVADLFR